MRKHADSIRQEAIRLRTELRLSLSQVAELTGASRGTCSYWLKAFPLTKEEISERNRRPKIHKDWKSKSRKSWGTPSKHYRDGITDKNQKGRIAEYAVAFRLALRKFEFYKSSDNGELDFIVNVGKLWRVQVKWARLTVKSGLPTAKTTRSNGRGKQRKYSLGDFDFLVIYNLYDDTAYVFPAAKVINKNSVSISPEYAEKWEQLDFAPVCQR